MARDIRTEIISIGGWALLNPTPLKNHLGSAASNSVGPKGHTHNIPTRHPEMRGSNKKNVFSKDGEPEINGTTLSGEKLIGSTFFFLRVGVILLFGGRSLIGEKKMAPRVGI